jgi:putative RNA 2'-phosphotransferase
MIRRCQEHGYFRGEYCPECDEKGRFLLDDEREQRLGRFVSGALRHFPDDLGLEMDLQGWVDLDKFCAIMKQRYTWTSEDRLIGLVESDVKNRYEIDGRYIRARYGHSVDVDLDYPIFEDKFLYYGVSQEEVEMLLEQGISPLRQTYVHLSTSRQRAIEAASVHTDNPVVLQVNAIEASETGVVFICANDDITLTEYVPAEFISIATESD